MVAVASRIEELRRRVDLDPASISFAPLAEEYRRAGQLDEAIALCRSGLQKHPGYLSAKVTLGRALFDAGDFDAARVEFEQVVRAAPENLAAIRGLADIHRRSGDLTVTTAVPPAPAPITSAQSTAAPSTPASASPAGPAAPAAQTAAAHMHVAASDPALSGLEEFLTAIKRAKAGLENPPADTSR